VIFRSHFFTGFFFFPFAALGTFWPQITIVALFYLNLWFVRKMRAGFLMESWVMLDQFFHFV
jgi:hypothetical protein